MKAIMENKNVRESINNIIQYNMNADNAKLQKERAIEFFKKLNKNIVKL